MIEWEKALIHEGAPVMDALRALDDSALQILAVVDKDNHLLGTLTDGDVRRGILNGFSLESPIALIMNRNPITAEAGSGRDQLLTILKKKRLHQVLLVDSDRRIVGIEVVDNLIRSREKANWVVLMAGGLGTRLRPLTNECPKPLLKLGDKPVLELILERLTRVGFSKFYLSVNYKAEQIREYFGDGSRWGVTIRYLVEKTKLGTAGSLGLISELPSEPLLVMNSDLLTSVNYEMLLDFHNEHRSVGTMCVREYKIQVPFGVVKVDQHRISSIEEKPVQRFFVNAGIYVLEPVVLESVEKDQYLDMPELFERLIGGGKETAVFPMHEDWLDIGRFDDLEKATKQYQTEKN